MKPRAKLALLLYAALTVAYLSWRLLWSLNPDAPVYSWAFLALETYAVFASLCFYWLILGPRERVAPPHPPGLAIDVFVCTYNESPDLVRQTVRRAQAMCVPHTTWLLDDGRRPEVKALACALGCRYLTRDKNTHFKAGNLNNALAHAEGDFVVVLDADHLVRHDFLSALIGYFNDPKVALVQTPQVYYNIDSFQHHFDPHSRRMWHEGAVFHHAIQAGADRVGAGLFVGTGAILRRSALDTIGGFAIGSVTEDVYTSMRLHAAGYRSVYHDEPLGYLQAPESLTQYLTQRLRWGQGAMQILRRANPLRLPGLSLSQRLVYFMSLSGFAQSLVHLVYYLAPAVFLLGGPAPIRVDRFVHFLPIFVHIVVDLVMFRRSLGRLARPLLAECYKFLNLFVFLKSLFAYFQKDGSLPFRVTTKGRDDGGSLRLLLPQAALLLINVTALGVGTVALVDGTQSLQGSLSIAVAAGFSGLFAVVGAMTFLFAHRRLAARGECSISDRIDATLSTDTGQHTACVVVRISPDEAHVLLAGLVHIAIGEGDRLTLSATIDRGAPLKLVGRVVARRFAKEGAVLRVNLQKLPATTQDRLFDRFANVSVPQLIDGLSPAWRSRRRSRLQTVETPYLPLEPNVL